MQFDTRGLFSGKFLCANQLYIVHTRSTMTLLGFNAGQMKMAATHCQFFLSPFWFCFVRGGGLFIHRFVFVYLLACLFHLVVSYCLQNTLPADVYIKTLPVEPLGGS